MTGNRTSLIKLFRRSLVIFVSFCVFSSHVFAGTLDDYYLSAFGVQTTVPANNSLQKAILSTSLPADTNPHCGTPLKHELRHDWNKLKASTQTTLAKQLALPLLNNEATFNSAGGHFKIHYSTSGADAPPAVDIDLDTVPDWVEVVAVTLDNVATAHSELGWRLAPTVGGAPYDVYLKDLASQKVYGQTISASAVPSVGYNNAYASFMEIDNDFLDVVFQDALNADLTPTEKAVQSLQIAATHEYNHAIQYGYNFYFDIWYAEAASTWYEDELYNGVNQLYLYLPSWFANSTLSLDTPASITTGGGYARWLFHRYLYERYGTPGIKAVWDTLATMDSPGSNADIPMAPVLENLLLRPVYNSTLGSDFFGFAKLIYLRNWISHTDEINRIHPYSPVSTLSSFPASGEATLAHYSFAFYKFTPSFTAPAYLDITIAKTSGIRTALFTSIAGILTEVPADQGGNYRVAGFNYIDPASDEVVLLIANTTNVDNHMASFSTTGNPYNSTEPSTTPAASSNGGGGGCFIATAAYGSYLHPQVQALRKFRDRALLTNAAGRALVAIYYRISPPLADLISRHELLKGATRVALTPVVVAVAHPALTGIFILLIILLLARNTRKGNQTQPRHPATVIANTDIAPTKSHGQLSTITRLHI